MLTFCKQKQLCGKQRHDLEDLRGQIDNDVRNALLDLNAAADQVEVARSSVDLAEQTLTQAQDRFSAGVATIWKSCKHSSRSPARMKITSRACMLTIWLKSNSPARWETRSKV